MDWFPADDIQKNLAEIIRHLDFKHVKTERVICFRSFGSTSRAQARIWSFPRIWQLALKAPAAYIIEVISEKFDKLSFSEQDKVIIHELLRIPKTFGGGFRHHDFVCEENVEIMYEKFASLKNPKIQTFDNSKRSWW